MTTRAPAQAAPAAPPSTGNELPLEQAVPMFLEYMRSYRSCSPLSIQAYRATLRTFQQFLSSWPGPLPAPAAITRQLVIQYAVSLSHWSPITVRSKLACLSSFFGFLQDMGYVSGNPAKRLPLPKLEQHVPVTLSEEQAQQLLAAADLPWHRCLVVLLLATGIRRSEAVQISLEDMDLTNRQLLVHGKGAKQRIVPLTRQAVAAIQQYLPHRPTTESRRLFVNSRGQPIRGHVINAALDEILEKAGLAGQGITPHKLRHTFATQLIHKGVDVRTVQELLADQLVDEFTAAEEIDRLRDEVAALGDLVNQARHVRDQASDSKLAALKDCLSKAEFDELKDGRGKLLLFTEHRDTLRHVREHLDRWGYSTCEIHGGMGPRERKQAEEDFRTRAQICVATEAAGEGINLQFCHLMINYDLPWNPTRLEQRLGRIHRIGQERDCYVFNFVANQSQDGQPIIEGRILERLLEKLDQMREVLGHERVFDVIGEVLSLNEINLPEMLRDAAYEPGRLDDYLDQIDRIDPEKLRQYEQVTGIALARSHVNFQSFERANLEAEEHRLMPEYVARYFLAAANLIGLRVEQRADGLWRIERVPQDLRSDHLESVRRAKPDSSYRKVTFNKADLEQDQHVDAVLLGPGHPLYAAVDEKANQRLGRVHGCTAVFVDPSAAEPYHLHFMEMEIRGNSRRSGDTAALHAELVAVKEQNGEFSVMVPDALHDLVPHPSPPPHLPAADTSKATDFLRSSYQLSACDRCRDERRQFAKVCEDYLRSSFEMRIRVAQDRVMKLRGRVVKGETEAQLALRDAENDLADLERTRKERLDGLSRLGIARTGPVAHVASVVVLPAGSDTLPLTPADIVDIETEIAAMNIAMEYERQRGREPTDVGRQKIGFDIRSLGPADPATGRREVRRIEVKGRAKGAPIRMTTNEWLKARQLSSTYWLYVVWGPSEPGAEPVIVKDPANRLEHAVRANALAGSYEVPASQVMVMGSDETAG